MTETELTGLRDAAHAHMSEKRYAHTLGVYDECAYLADKCGLSGEEKDDLLTAALLHDIAKQLSREEQEDICRRNVIDTSGATAATLHQLSGAAYARELLGDSTVNARVFSAISKHTTGAAAMSLTDKILFIADYTEAGRTQEACRKMREYLHAKCEKIEKADEARQIINEVALTVIKNTIEYLAQTGDILDPRINEARATLEAEEKRAKES